MADTCGSQGRERRSSGGGWLEYIATYAASVRGCDLARARGGRAPSTESPSERDRIMPVGEGARRAQTDSSLETVFALVRVEGDSVSESAAATPNSASSRCPSASGSGVRPSGRERQRACLAPRCAGETARVAELMKRAFAIDVLECPRCRGPMRILATIHSPETTSAILASLDLSVRALPLAPARRDRSFDDEAADQSPADFEP